MGLTDPQVYYYVEACALTITIPQIYPGSLLGHGVDKEKKQKQKQPMTTASHIWLIANDQERKVICSCNRRSRRPQKASPGVINGSFHARPL